MEGQKFCDVPLNISIQANHENVVFLELLRITSAALRPPFARSTRWNARERRAGLRRSGPPTLQSLEFQPSEAFHVRLAGTRRKLQRSNGAPPVCAAAPIRQIRIGGRGG